MAAFWRHGQFGTSWKGALVVSKIGVAGSGMPALRDVASIWEHALNVKFA